MESFSLNGEKLRQARFAAKRRDDNTCHDGFTVIHNGRMMSKRKVSKPGTLLLGYIAQWITAIDASTANRVCWALSAKRGMSRAIVHVLHFAWTPSRSTRFPFRSTFSAYGRCIVLRGDCVNSESFWCRFTCSAFSGRLAKSVRRNWFRVQAPLLRCCSRYTDVQRDKSAMKGDNSQSDT